MADALVQVALQRLTQALGQQIQLFTGASDELQKLKAMFQSIKAVLADVESRQVEEKSAQLWLSRLRNVSYDIEDLLNDWLLTFAHDDDGEAIDSGNKFKKLICKCYSFHDAFFHHGVARYKLAREMKEIRGRLDDIAKDKEQFNPRQISSSFGGDARPVRWSRTMTSSYMNEQMIGRDDDKQTVINLLISASGNSTGNGDAQQQQRHQVQVIAIVGIGGLGKTTLARKIYHDKEVQDHFNGFLYWVCVSQDFDLNRLLKAIIEQVKGAATSFVELDSLQKELVEALRGKCFLLVLDDMWNSDTRRWNMLQPCLAVGAPGSKILVTTRLQVVAENTMNASHIHELKALSDNHSWTLFRSIAFSGRIEEKYFDQLESVGREIVRKCKGVPLSITVMGSVMNSKRTVEDWQNMLDSKIWSLPKAENKILPALWLSYYNLPPHLKQCFAYCSMLPEDSTVCKDTLVQMWIAQGFVQSQGNRETEDVGAEYADDLAAWSMLQEQVVHDGITTYRMHDLLHELAKFVAKGEIYESIGSEGGISDERSSNNLRHAFLDFTEDNNIPPTFFSCAKKLRTLVLFEVDETNSIVLDLLHQARYLRFLFFRLHKMFPKAICKLKHLRYLKLSRSKIAELPTDIGKMKQLTYLDFSSSSIVALPETVSRLCNLRTLKLSECRILERLPKRMGEMVSLRYLEIDGTHSLKCLPQGLGRISCLRSLCKFIVGGEGGCGIHELQRLNALNGSLEIQNLERVSSEEGAERAELQSKPNLHRLVLFMFDDDADRDTGMRVNVLEGLRPHVNLEELKLKCDSRSSKLKLPSWIEDSSFSNLTKLTIKGFVNYCDPKILPGIGKLPALKFLKVKKVGIRKLGHEFYHGNSSSNCDVISIAAFPKLEELSLSDLNELEEWELPKTRTMDSDDDAAVKEIIIMPSLRKLKLSFCSRLEGLPDHLSIAPLESLQIHGCDRIKGRGCPWFPFLEEFTLRESCEIFWSGLPNLSNLKTFKIHNFRNERFGVPDNGGWEQLVALRKLEISCCAELTSLPDGLTQMESLENLEISDCPRLQSLPEALGQLKKLKKLWISDLRALTHLPDSVGQLESLENLSISVLEKLKSLPHSLGQLGALKHLRIQYCRALASLPDGLRHLSLLQELAINNCRLLSERCHREGVDWPKISHIPKIIIDHDWIQ